MDREESGECLMRAGPLGAMLNAALEGMYRVRPYEPQSKTGAG
jgi:hypothetical protein